MFAQRVGGHRGEGRWKFYGSGPAARWRKPAVV